MRKDLDQRIAAAEAKLSALRQQGRKLENGQKIILGGMLLNAVRKDQAMRQWLLKEAEGFVTRDVDKSRIEPLLAELRSIDSTKTAPKDAAK